MGFKFSSASTLPNASQASDLEGTLEGRLKNKNRNGQRHGYDTSSASSI
jgi:hypothetical protein